MHPFSNHLSMKKIIFILLVFNAVSCQRERPEILLQQAKGCYPRNLDSTYLFLKKIEKPEKLTEEQQARYGLLMTQCQYYNGIRITSDSLVRVSVDYYHTTGDTAKFLQSLFYTGLANAVSGNVDRALLFYRKTDSVASILRDTLMLCQNSRRTSFAYRYLNKNDSAITWHLKALEYYQQLKYTGWIFLWEVATAYEMNEDYDRSLAYFEKVKEMALLYQNNDLFSSVCHEMSRIYEKQQEFGKALEYASLALKYRNNRKDAAVYNLSKGKTFLEMRQGDSARHYLMRAVQNPNRYVATEAYLYLSDLDHMEKNNEKAYYSFLNYRSGLDDAKSGISAKIMQERYQDEKLKNENNELKLAKREREIYVLVLCVVLLVIFVLAYGYYTFEKRRKHEQKEQELKDKTLLVEKENLILKQERELSQLREKAAGLRETLFRKMSVSRKIPSLDHIDKDMEENGQGKIALTEQDWTELTQTVDSMYGGFVVRLKEQFTELNISDIRFCCLVKININMQDLSDIYCISKAGITKKKMRLKKDKLNVRNEHVSLDEFLQNF